MAPSQNSAGQEGIKFNQRAGIVFHETEKAERETGVNDEDVGRPSTIKSITGYSGGREREREKKRGGGESEKGERDYEKSQITGNSKRQPLCKDCAI